jgi:hypothetical protein
VIRSSVHASLVLTLITGLAAYGQSKPPAPSKPDVPYLIHAANLIETEQETAVEETRKDDMLYVVPGAASTVKTPLAGPEFMFRSESIDPDNFQLYRLESKNGRRELLFRHKKKILADAIRITVFPMDEGLARIRVYESLTAGEYCLTPSDSNTVFCFTVY